LIGSGAGTMKTETCAQLILGFTPGDGSHPEPYFYPNPWIFKKGTLLDKKIPPVASWYAG